MSAAGDSGAHFVAMIEYDAGSGMRVLLFCERAHKIIRASRRASWLCSLIGANPYRQAHSSEEEEAPTLLTCSQSGRTRVLPHEGLFTNAVR